MLSRIYWGMLLGSWKFSRSAVSSSWMPTGQRPSLSVSPPLFASIPPLSDFKGICMFFWINLAHCGMVLRLLCKKAHTSLFLFQFAGSKFLFAWLKKGDTRLQVCMLSSLTLRTYDKDLGVAAIIWLLLTWDFSKDSVWLGLWHTRESCAFHNSLIVALIVAFTTYTWLPLQHMPGRSKSTMSFVLCRIGFPRAKTLRVCCASLSVSPQFTLHPDTSAKFDFGRNMPA